MALSDREQDILRRLEQDLLQDDMLKKAAQRTAASQRSRNLKVGIAGLVIGFIMLFSIAFSQVIAVMGAVVIFASLLLLASTLNRTIKHKPTTSSSRS